MIFHKHCVCTYQNKHRLRENSAFEMWELRTFACKQTVCVALVWWPREKTFVVKISMGGTKHEDSLNTIDKSVYFQLNLCLLTCKENYFSSLPATISPNKAEWRALHYNGTWQSCDWRPSSLSSDKRSLHLGRCFNEIYPLLSENRTH